MKRGASNPVRILLQNEGVIIDGLGDAMEEWRQHVQYQYSEV